MQRHLIPWDRQNPEEKHNPFEEINFLLKDNFIYQFADSIFGLQSKNDFEDWESFFAVLNVNVKDILWDLETLSHYSNAELSTFSASIQPQTLAALDLLIKNLPNEVDQFPIKKTLKEIYIRSLALLVDPDTDDLVPDILNNIENESDILIRRLFKISKDDKEDKENYLPREKELARNTFIEIFNLSINDPNQLLIAFNSRRSIGEKHNEEDIQVQFESVNDLESALKDIDGNRNKYDLYSRDQDRLGSLLIGLGFKKTELDKMKTSTILKYEAALFHAVSATVSIDLSGNTPNIAQQNFDDINKSDKPLRTQRAFLKFQEELLRSPEVKEIISKEINQNPMLSKVTEHSSRREPTASLTDQQLKARQHPESKTRPLTSTTDSIRQTQSGSNVSAINPKITTTGAGQGDDDETNKLPTDNIKPQVQQPVARKPPVESEEKEKPFRQKLTGGLLGTLTGFGIGLFIGSILAPVTFGASVLIGIAIGGAVGAIVGGVLGGIVGLDMDRVWYNSSRPKGEEKSDQSMGGSSTSKFQKAMEINPELKKPKSPEEKDDNLSDKQKSKEVKLTSSEKAEVTDEAHKSTYRNK